MYHVDCIKRNLTRLRWMCIIGRYFIRAWDAKPCFVSLSYSLGMRRYLRMLRVWPVCLHSLVPRYGSRWHDLLCLCKWPVGCRYVLEVEGIERYRMHIFVCLVNYYYLWVANIIYTKLRIIFPSSQPVAVRWMRVKLDTAIQTANMWCDFVSMGGFYKILFVFGDE